MTNHVDYYLSSFVDKELSNEKHKLVENHLASCATCKQKYHELVDLSILLQDMRAPKIVSAKDFANQLSGKLLATQQENKLFLGKNFYRWGILTFMMIAWIYIFSITHVNNIVFAVNNLAIFDQFTSTATAESTSSYSLFETFLTQFHFFDETTINLYSIIRSFISTNINYLFVKLSLSTLYLFWILQWWAQNKLSLNRKIISF